MSIYDELQIVASGIFAEFKQGSVVHVSVSQGSGPPDEPTGIVETQREIDATVQNASTAKGLSYFVKQSTVVAGDLLVSTGVPAVAFNMRDFIIVDGVRHKIVAIIPKPAAGVPVAFSLLVRR